jgi:hypothetical protein
MNTFDAQGRLLGDDEDDGSIGSPSNPLALPTMTVTAAPPSAGIAALLQPPYVYFLVAAIGLLAYIVERDKR